MSGFGKYESWNIVCWFLMLLIGIVVCANHASIYAYLSCLLLNVYRSYFVMILGH